MADKKENKKEAQLPELMIPRVTPLFLLSFYFIRVSHPHTH